MLHTFVPAEDFFARRDESFTTLSSGGRWLCLRGGANGNVVERVISTNPFDYLDPAFAPGMSCPAAAKKAVNNEQAFQIKKERQKS